MIKKTISILSMILMVGCAKNSKNEAGGDVSPNIGNCGFSVLRVDQIETIWESMLLQFNDDQIRGSDVGDFAGFLTFQILRQKSDFDMLTSISRGEIYELIKLIHIEGTERIKNFDIKDVEKIKNCNWRL